MTLNGVMAVILRYFTEFSSFRGALHKSGFNGRRRWPLHVWCRRRKVHVRYLISSWVLVIVCTLNVRLVITWFYRYPIFHGTESQCWCGAKKLLTHSDKVVVYRIFNQWNIYFSSSLNSLLYARGVWYHVRSTALHSNLTQTTFNSTFWYDLLRSQ